ncbi:MAG TPA: hypothetical protein VLL97_03405 [Acidobacteriota bacterium]|nr:hypothetical protein [Acidobacteriota bacterium]
MTLILIPAATEWPSLLWGQSAYRISAEAAERGARKLQSLEKFSTEGKAGTKQTTRFTEEEVNSYLAFNLNTTYHPSLKKLVLTFNENSVTVAASIDFDRLGEISSEMMSRLISLIFSGTRTLTAEGQIISGQGKAHFNLKQARLDDRTIPNYLVNEIIALVGKTRNPPFDPMNPSELPHKIKSIALHSGFVIVHQ